MSVTIYEIVRLASVSPRTVTRAFQEDSVIRPETRERIIRIAAENGYQPNRAASRIQGKDLLIGAVIDNSVPAFSQSIEKGLKAAQKELADMKTTLDIRTAASREEKDAAVHDFLENHADGLVLTGGKLLSEDTEARITDEKIPFVSLTFDSPLHKRICYVNDDSYLRGQMAGELFSLLLPGKRVGVFSGDTKEKLHREILRGFEEQTAFTVTDIYDTRDEPETARRIILALLEKELPFDGLFFTSANSAPVIEELRRSPYRPLIVASDLYPQMAEYIRDGTVTATLFRNPFEQARTAVRHLYTYLTEHILPPEHDFITPQIVLKSNLSRYED